jgi:hypothetical protein
VSSTSFLEGPDVAGTADRAGSAGVDRPRGSTERGCYGTGLAASRTGAGAENPPRALPEPIRVEAVLEGITTPRWRSSNSLITGLIPTPAAVALLVPPGGSLNRAFIAPLRG